jgi:hypothetical protein
MSEWTNYDEHLEHQATPMADCDFCTEEDTVNCTEEDVRGALVAALRERVEVAGAYVGLETPAGYLDRLAALRYGAETGATRPVEELKRLHRSAGALLELLAHGAVPMAGVLS